jgi:hypothetical protein
MSLVVFEPTISAGEQPPTYALEYAPAGTGNRLIRQYKNNEKYSAGIHNLGFPSAGHNPPPFVRESKEITNIMERSILLHFACLSNSITAYMACN